MNYKIRPGVTLVNICGANLLIPTRVASEFCPNIIRLGRFGVLLWNSLDGKLPMELVIKLLSKLGKNSKQETKEIIENTLQKLYQEGCLIRDEEET